MNTFLYRDARKLKLEEALAAADGAAEGLRALLQQELDALQAEDWPVSDRTYLAVGADWLWSIREALKALVDDDPALRVLAQAAALSEDQAAAILALPHGPGGPPPDYLDQVRAAADGDETVFTGLLHAAHRRWIIQPASQRPYPFDDVGVLLPVRLETLFDEPATRFNDNPTRYKLSLRVVPDEASICRDEPFVSPGEQQALAEFWNTIQQPGAPDPAWLEGKNAPAAWQKLADRVTAPRAAWLAANLEAQRDGETIVVALPADMPEKVQPNRIGGMPPELQVIAVSTTVIGGETLHTLGRLPQDPARQINSSALDLPLPTGSAEDHQRWWSNWETAKAVGLGGEWVLPEGMTPQNIAAIYVVGIGEETPERHFKAQVDAGELGLLRLGVPTNAVHGQPAADLGKASADWRKIARLRLLQKANPDQRLISGPGKNLQQHLLGGETDLPFFPAADSPDDTQDSQKMLRALWPALWGHWLLDLWQTGEDAFRVGSWMVSHFLPEGPLMPIRIGDQPYGVLPVTALSRWESAPGLNAEAQAQAAVEAAMAGAITRLRAAWEATVIDKRSVVGKTSEQFMRLLGQDALSRRYIQREFSPARVQMIPYINAFGLNPDQQKQFQEIAHSTYQSAIDFLGLEPKDIYLANSFWRRHELPLVQPSAMPYRRGGNLERERYDLLTLLQQLLDGMSLEPMFGETLHALPDSLLLRLLIYAAQLAAPWRQLQMTPAQKRVVNWQQEGTDELAKELDQDAWRGEVRDEVTGEVQRFTITIPVERRGQLERALRATLDSAATRIDPYVTGFAWQRLKQHSTSPRHMHRMGIYGWVDGPFNGTPGPTAAGRLHTPSYNQTLAALILRDKFLTAQRAGHANDGGRNPWEMNISSRKARLAEEIADEVRMGFHIYEIVGRHIENILGDQPGGPQIVRQLRVDARYAMHPERKDPNEVCNGNEALQGLLAPDPLFPLNDSQRFNLLLLRDALDTYGDLLMADGVMQLVNRQVERAAETMEAAAGHARPPSFEFTRTPPSGYQLESLVLSALPYRSIAEVGADPSPVRLADPSVAQFLEEQLSGDWTWTAQRVEDDAQVGSATLAELGFAAHETLALAADFLSELVRRKLGLTQETIRAPRQHALAQELVTALGSRPAAGRDFSSDPVTQQAANREIYAELLTRYQALLDSCAALIAGLGAAADDGARAALLRRALVWGVTPTSEAADRETLYALLLGTPLPETGTLPEILAANVASVLQKRLDAAPKLADLPAAENLSKPLPDHEELKKAGNPDGISTLARAITTLASPNSKLAVLACWTRDTLVADSGLVLDQPELTLDETWLTVVAAARANLARLEALQLEVIHPLSAWTNAPGDPWQQKLVADNLEKRDSGQERLPGESPLRLRMRRFTAVYGPGTAWGGEKVAAGMIDSFSEAIPMPQRTSTAAFGFNSPAARAAQAILLAVPPKPRQRLDSKLVQQIVAETRQLAHSRTARIEDLGAFQSLAPTTWLLSSGDNRVHLEPYPLFE